jgi:hypothetical protein
MKPPFQHSSEFHILYVHILKGQGLTKRPIIADSQSFVEHIHTERCRMNQSRGGYTCLARSLEQSALSTLSAKTFQPLNIAAAVHRLGSPPFIVADSRCVADSVSAPVATQRPAGRVDPNCYCLLPVLMSSYIFVDEGTT